MKPTCIVTPGAEADLVAIGTYIAQDNPSAARRQLAMLQSKSMLLAAFPGLGRLDEERPGRRVFVAEPYLIVYRDLDEGVEILRYVHGRRDRQL